MKAQRKGGRGQNRRTPTSIVIVVLLGLAGGVRADTVWLSGHHEIGDGDVYGEIYIYNDVTVDILGGDIYMLEAFNVTATDWYAGEMTELFGHNDSIVNIYGGQLSRLQAAENSVINLYAYDVIHTTTGGYWDAGQLTGKYLNDNSNFVFDLHYTAYPHVSIVPEPGTLFLFGLGGLMLRKRHQS
jgi:hypothetical protein